MKFPFDRLLLSKIIDALDEEDDSFTITLEDGGVATIFHDDCVDIGALVEVLKRVLGQH